MNHLGMFAKYWQAGSVKTRLAESIGEVAASQIYFHCLESLLQRFGDQGDIRTVVYCPPENKVDFVTVAGDKWQIAPQSSGDLGVRMRHFFENAFEQGATRVVLIGSDSPTVPRLWIQRAWQMLHRCKVVLGPATDGGYYLVGMSEFVPAIFEDVRWSTSHVLEETRSKLTEAGLACIELPTWYDVDGMDDLRQLRQELAEGPPGDGDWTKLRVAIDDVI